MKKQMTEPVTDKKVTSQQKKNVSENSSGMKSSQETDNAVDHVKATSKSTVKGSSKLANTGPDVEYGE